MRLAAGLVLLGILALVLIVWEDVLESVGAEDMFDIIGMAAARPSRRGVVTPDPHEFLKYSIACWGSDLRVEIPAFLVAAVGIFLVPLRRVSSHLSTFLTLIPPFVVVTGMMMWGGATWWMIALVIGVLAMPRVLIVLGKRVSELEKDDYRIFMMLGGRSPYSITLLHTFPMMSDVISSTLSWTFATIVVLVLNLSFLDLGDFTRPSLGALLRVVYMYPSSEKVRSLLYASLLLGEVVLTIAAVFLTSWGVRDLFMRRMGISSRRGRVKRGKFARLDGVDSVVVRDLEVSAGYGRRILRIDGELELRRGDKVFVMGESGAGKSVLCNTILGNVDFRKLSYTGEVVYNGVLNVLSRRGRRALMDSGVVEVVPQNPRSAFDKYTPVEKQLRDLGVYEDVMDVIGRYFGEGVRERVEASVKEPPSGINDGYLQIINFVVSVVRSRGKRSLILFDEPVASLSRESIDTVLRIIEEELWDEDHTVLWIGHEVWLTERLGFNRFLVVRRVGDHSEVFEERRAVEEMMEGLRRAEEVLKGIVSDPGEELIEADVKGVRFGRRCVEIGRKFDVRDGELVLIVGDNGAGKSTLMKAMIGYHRKNVDGDVIYRGIGSVKKKWRKVWKVVDVVLQNPDASLPQMSRVSSILKDTSVARRLGIADHLDKRVYQLSYGQKKRLMIARAVSKKPVALFLDEPTASLDAFNVEKVAKLLADLKEEGLVRAVVIITHDRVFDGLAKKVKTIRLSGRR